VSKVLAFAFLLLSAAITTACAQVLSVKCERRPGYAESNVYHQDIIIDLSEPAVEVQQLSTVQENDGHRYIYRNHRADPDVMFDQDKFVVVSDDWVQWGTGAPDDGLITVYYRQQKILIELHTYYDCTEG
jgi:hypothetical protein